MGDVKITRRKSQILDQLQHNYTNMNILRSRKLASGAALLLSVSGFAVSGLAQATSNATTEEESVELEKFVVTGSYIPTTETSFSAGASPVIRIDRKVIDQVGISTAAELLQKITISNAGSVPISNNATGFTSAATSASLRGLGPEATLVLVNGRRVAPYPVGTDGATAFVDLNSIPLAAVGSIEILKDGASALYGADAVAGVINIKMRRGMDGTEMNVSYGNTTSHDSSEFSASIMTGAQSDKASFIIGFNYYDKNPIYNADRSYSAVPPFLSSNSSPINLQISREAALEAGIPAASIPAVDPDDRAAALLANPNLDVARYDAEYAIFAASPADTSNTGNTPIGQYLVGGSRIHTFNFNADSMAYPARKNKGIMAAGERKIFDTDNVSIYMDLSFQNSFTQNELAPSATGNWASPGGIELVIPARTANPLPLPGGDTRARSAADGAYNPFNPFNVDITGGTRARLYEFGNRIFRNETDSTMLSFGMKGENVLDKWNFDANYSYSAVQDTSRNTLVSSSRFNQVVNQADPIFDPASSTFIGTTTAYNPFGYWETPIDANAAVTQYAKVTTKDVNESELQLFSFVASTGELFEMPAGPVGFAFGADARQERLNQFPDAFGLTGDLIGSGTNATTNAQRKIAGFFAEFKLPILSGVEGANVLEADVAIRHEQFFTSDRDTTVPKIGVRWQPLDDSLTLRASWSEGFREPSMYELYATPIAVLQAVTDPRNGNREPEQDATLAGNRRLGAEETDYVNLGFVWSPKTDALRGFTFGVDFWDISRLGTVDADAQDTVNRWFGTDEDGAPAPGGLLPGESVLLGPGGDIQLVNSIFFNVGETKASGYDFTANYVLNTDEMGRFEFGVLTTWLKEYDLANTLGGVLEDQIGLDATGSSDDFFIEWKSRVSVDWTFRNWNVYVGANYTGGYDDADYDVDFNEIPFRGDDTWIFDAQVSYNFRGDFLGKVLSDTKLTFGARNLFDQDPPFASGLWNNSTGYPGFLYSPEGQYFYLSMNRKL